MEVKNMVSFTIEQPRETSKPTIIVLQGTDEIPLTITYYLREKGKEDQKTISSGLIPEEDTDSIVDICYMNDVLVMMKKSQIFAFTSPNKNGDFRYRSDLNVGFPRDVVDNKDPFTVLRCQENGFMGLRTIKKAVFIDSLKIMNDRKGSISSFNLTEKDSQKYPIIKDLKNNLSYFGLRTIESAPLVFLSENHSSISFTGNL